MNNAVLTTQGTSGKYRTRTIIGGALLAVVGLFLLIVFFLFSSRSSDSRLAFILIIALFILFDAFVTTSIGVVSAKSYVNVYQDKFVGKGMQKLNLLDFNLPASQISNVSVSGNSVLLQTAAGEYKIVTDKDTAQKITAYFNQYMRG